MNITVRHAALREALCEGMRELERLGLNRGTAGNLSVRDGTAFLITPSGVKPRDLATDAIVAMTAQGEALDAAQCPSSEWRFHRDIYAVREDVQAIVHVHSTHATALACQGRDLPPFHYMIAVAGGADVRCAPYATFGSQALSDAALGALAGRRACLLANHGVIALGDSVERAIGLAVEIEELARQYLLACATGEPVLLDDAEMSRVLEAFKNYGARRS